MNIVYLEDLSIKELYALMFEWESEKFGFIEDHIKKEKVVSHWHFIQVKEMNKTIKMISDYIKEKENK